MLGAIFLIGSALLGVSVMHRVFRGLVGLCEQVLWGIVSGWMMGVLVAYALARFQGRLAAGTTAVATVLILLAGGAVSYRSLKQIATSIRSFDRSRLRTVESIGLGIVLVTFCPVLWWLFSSHTFLSGSDGIYSGGSAFYDLSFHATLASSFLYGDNFPAMYPLLAGETLRYPFLPDFHAATLMAGGLSMRSAFLCTELPLAIVIIVIFYRLALRMTLSVKAAVLAVALFLLNGGLGFIDMLRDWQASGSSFLAFWSSLPRNYTNYAARGLNWNNIVTDMFLPQRTFLYGLSAGMIILTLFAIVWEDKLGPARKRKMLVFAGIIAGVLPLFHTHSYIAVGLISVVLFLLKPRREWLWFWLPALLLAAPELLDLARAAGGENIVRWQPGWLGSDAPSLTVYLLWNFGLSLLLAIPAWLTAPRLWKTFYLAALSLLVLTFTVVVSPNVLDNGKFTYYWHAINSILIARWLVSLFDLRSLRMITAPSTALLVFLSIVTGIAAIKAESQQRELLFSQRDIAVAAFVREQTPRRALFLTAPAFNHPVTGLAGRSVVRGPTDWLWAHGYEFRDREWDVRRIYAGGAEALDLLRYYGVDYVYVGDVERNQLAANQAFFDEHLSAVYRLENVTIYQVPPAAGGSPNARAEQDLASRVGGDPFAMLGQFSRIGYVAHKMLQARFSRAPTYPEFISAMKVLGTNLRIGSDGWEDQLTANRHALAASLSDGDEALAQRLDGEASNRDTHDYEASYLRAHFFAYLGRDPDPAGFDFWMRILSRDKDYRSLSRAFIESTEYKDRALNWVQPNNK